MSIAPAASTDRLHIRLSDRQKKLLVAAARARHLPTGAFVVQASLDAAAQVLSNQDAIRLTSEQWEAFAERLDEPARTVPALQKLFAEPEPF